MAWAVSGNIRGPQGPAGAQGIQGPAGAVGPAGLTWRGAWAAGTAYAIDDAVGRNGASWFAPAAIAAGNDPNPSGDGRTAANGWAPLALEGAQGPQGPVGADGAAGAQGPQGIQGPQGVAGAQGAQGPQGIAGVRGSNWYTGHGAPGAIGGSQPNDQYLDVDTGDVYSLA